MKIKFGKHFSKIYDKTPIKIQKAFQKRLTLFITDPFHPILNNHSLSGKYQGCKSINITGGLRAIFKNKDHIITFKEFGTHSQLYK